MRRFGILSLLVCTFSICFIACTEEESELGMGLQDPGSIFDGKVCDTITATAVTILDDSLLTSNYSVGVIGYYHDDVFGKVKASMYTQAALSTPSTGVSFLNTTIDSVVVTLMSIGNFPNSSDSNAMHNLHFEVNEILDDMYLDTSYYATDCMNLGDKYFDDYIEFRNIDSVVTLKLDATIHSKFANKEFTDNANFFETLKGLCIKMNYDGLNDYMLYVNYWATATAMTVYYTDNETYDTSQYVFLFDKTAAHFNRYEHDYSGTPLSIFQTNRTDSIRGNESLYLEALGGTAIKFRFPYSIEWGKKHPHATIHQAELFVSVPDEPINDKCPSSIICYRYTESGGLVTVPDMVDGVLSEGFDGKFNSTNRCYRMRITRQIQQMLTGKVPDLPLVLYVNSRRSSANRCIISGTATDKPMKLKIIYTE